MAKAHVINAIRRIHYQPAKWDSINAVITDRRVPVSAALTGCCLRSSMHLWPLWIIRISQGGTFTHSPCLNRLILPMVGLISWWRLSKAIDTCAASLMTIFPNGWVDQVESLCTRRRLNGCKNDRWSYFASFFLSLDDLLSREGNYEIEDYDGSTIVDRGERDSEGRKRKNDFVHSKNFKSHFLE